jgi:hypothetical protein
MARDMLQLALRSMRAETRLFQRQSGWSAPLPTALDSDRTAVFVFGASALVDNPEPLLAVRRAFPRAAMLGCSTAGEIHGARVYDDGAVVAVARFDAVAIRPASAPTGVGAASLAAGTEIAKKLASPDLRAMIVLSEGLEVNGSELVRGINAVTPPSVVVTGGLAADGDRFRRTWVFDGDAAAPRRVVALGLYGDRLAVTHGSKGGWDIFGPERRVTRSAGNILYELDGKPALRLYKEYLGERAAGLPATALLFPLAMRTARGEDKQLVRTVLAVDEQAQSLTFAGDIPTGSLVQLMRANFDRLVQGASDAATIARGTRELDGDVLSLAISCVGRRLVLGERTEEELEATLDVLPPGAKQAGFYSYGEISPFASGSCDLHNQTMTLSTLAET